MRAQERIRVCRLIEKANRNKKAAEGLGIRNNSRFDPSKVESGKCKGTEK